MIKKVAMMILARDKTPKGITTETVAVQVTKETVAAQVTKETAVMANQKSRILTQDSGCEIVSSG